MASQCQHRTRAQPPITVVMEGRDQVSEREWLWMDMAAHRESDSKASRCIKAYQALAERLPDDPKLRPSAFSPLR